jgi:hypothetical protein
MGGEELGFFASLAKAFQDGGIGMYPIAFMSVFAIAVLADRIIALYFRDNINKDAFMRGLKKYIYAGDLDKAISYVASQKKTPLTAVVKAGLINVPKGEDEVQAAMDEASLRENPKIEKRTGYLAMIGNVSTLFGLLGTILGLIKCSGDEGNGALPRYFRSHELHGIRVDGGHSLAARLLGAAGAYPAHARRHQRDVGGPAEPDHRQQGQDEDPGQHAGRGVIALE